MLAAGDEAPDFEIAPGLRASTLWNDRHLVVYFFPKAFTPG
jgi:peroxiredoxin